MTIKALTFDVFGTVVDWRSAVIAEVGRIAQSKGLDIDCGAFTDEWKSVYRPTMDRINSGTEAWMGVGAIFRRQLDRMLPKYGLHGLPEPEKDQLNGIWCRPVAWEDSASAIERLKTRYIVSTLSNGDFSCLVHIAKFCALPFDCIITAENARAYKPDARVYRTGLELLGVDPAEALMVACHNYDLAAARQVGLRTAFLPRKEHGPAQQTDQTPEDDWDFVATDLRDLAAKLDC